MILKYPYILFLAILTVSCSKSAMLDEMEPNNELSQDSIPGISYLALGDSYTIGEGVAYSERWPIQLIDSLAEKSIAVDSVTIIAQTGWTTTDLLNAIENSNPTKHSLVSLLIGVNNQFQNKPFSLMQTEFSQLLDKSILLAGGIENVFVVSIPDYGATPFGSTNSESIALQLNTYNQYMKMECESRDIPFVDITTISRELKDNPDALASDRLHPSGAQYSLWVSAMLDVVADIIDM